MRRPKRNKNILSKELQVLTDRLVFLNVKNEKRLNAFVKLASVNIDIMGINFSDSIKAEILKVESQIKKNRRETATRQATKNKRLLNYTMKDMINQKSNAVIKTCRFFTGQGQEILIDPAMYHNKHENNTHLYNVEALTVREAETFIDIFKLRLAKFYTSSEYYRRQAGNGSYRYRNYVHYSNFGLLCNSGSKHIEAKQVFLSNIRDTLFCKYLNVNKNYSLKLDEIYVVIDNRRINKSVYKLQNKIGSINSKFKRAILCWPKPSRGGNTKSLIAKELDKANNSVYNIEDKT